MSGIQAEVDEFLQDRLDERLAQLTEPQRIKFGKCFPRGVTPETVTTAIDLCDRTIRKNEADAAAQAGGDPMALPEGRTCADCRHCDYCRISFQCKPTNTSCDWSPSRFERGRKAAESPADSQD